MIECSNVKLPLDAAKEGSEGTRACMQSAAKALGLSVSDIAIVRVLRRSIDARRKRNVHFVATLAVELKDPMREEQLLRRKDVRPYIPYEPPVYPEWPSDVVRPIVVGSGPAGLFATLYLARCGARPLLVERGADVETRAQAVDAFNETGVLNPTTNVQFGEGGAGTFSDGKLTTNIKNPRAVHVLHWFVDAGAPKDILWKAHPHIGSDNLPRVLKTMREEIICLGGEVRFHTRLVDVRIESGLLTGVELDDGKGGVKVFEPCESLVIAMGHSARDTFEMLAAHGFAMERKPFSMGVRIEHPQELIDQALWGSYAGHPALGAAEYKYAVHLPSGRSVYTFCMCPGGTVVAAASQEGCVVTNGMSNHARDGENANAAMLVNIEPDDMGDADDPLVGLRMQERFENRAYLVGRDGADGAPYKAPAQRVGDFLATSTKASGKVDARKHEGDIPRTTPTYPRGVTWADLHDCLPSFVTDALEEALPLLDRRFAGFARSDAVMTAPETRSSSPVRVKRGSDYQAYINVDAATAEGPAGTGVFPAGEGPGYAGGIMSAAVDGMRIAEAVVASARGDKPPAR